MPQWDVAVIGAGPAGLAAARASAAAGARTVVFERARHPRYKTCGGGLIGASLIAAVPHISIPTREHIDAVTFTHNGRARVTHRSSRRLLSLVRREDFDDALRLAALEAGAIVREAATVRALDATDGHPRVRLADGTVVSAAVVIGADGSSGVTARHVGVISDQVDLGLEVELPIGTALRRRWHGRVLIDWGPIPGSYGWVFPKDGTLTVGVIASRGTGAAARAYLRGFVHRLGLDGIEPTHDSGHLTRCRSQDSPLRRGTVVVAGDAAGLLEPWTREGISFALRSGELAGIAAGAGDLDSYVTAVHRTLVPEMLAGQLLREAFTRRPAMFHAALATPLGWQAFHRFCRSEMSFASILRHRPLRALVAAMGAG